MSTKNSSTPKQLLDYSRSSNDILIERDLNKLKIIVISWLVCLQTSQCKDHKKMILKVIILFVAIFAFSQCLNENEGASIDKCKDRRVDFKIFDKSYFVNVYLDDINHPVSWPEARAACQSYCTDLMSINYEEEFIVMKDVMEQLQLDYFWTSGHVCEKEQCDDESYPININGWRWLDLNERMPPTNETPPGWSFNPWSQTGFKKLPQPDNAEIKVTNTNESCLAILHNVYSDGIKFHDVACYHEKDFICEYYTEDADY